ncbi:MAG: carbohydrate binding domain-containing protein [Phycisphaerales bacterium]
MGKIRSFAVLVCVLSVASAWGAPFKDDFDRPNGAVGNGWTILRDGTVDSTIVDNEVVVAGTTSASAWQRCGISRAVVGETKFSCDFKNDDVFNFHMQITLGTTVWSEAYIEVYAWVGGPLQYANSLDGNWPAAGWVAMTGADAQTTAGQYNHLMMEVGEGGVVTVTLNGKLAGTITNPSLTSIGSVTFASDADANTTGSVHIDNVEIGTVIAGSAKDPSPAVGATDVPREVLLGWTPGESAAQHRVYFGTAPEDVNDATQPVASVTDAAFDPEGLLEFGQTYYWRIDEVNGAPDYTVIQGDIWSFTAEPYAYPITSLMATASSAQPASPASRTIDGSGLDEQDQHDVELNQMWMTPGGLPAWIQYTFDKEYSLREMWVWNVNSQLESFMGFGAKEVTVEYTTDGQTWTALENVPQFAQGNGTVAYTANTIVDFGKVMARYVRLIISDNWGATEMVGLSEVRFYYVPVNAREPQPQDGAASVSLEPTLSWRPGREAVSHKVYFSDDKQAVADGTAPSETVTTNRYEVSGLAYGKYYYWRVDEVNDAASIPVREGDVWSFSTIDYFVVDDFESYDDNLDAQTTIWHTWVDGLTDKASGSQVGYDTAPFAERVIVNNGEQSMPFLYNNADAPYYSQAYREFESLQDWTVNGVTDLILYVRGYPAVGEVAVAETGGKMNVTGAGADIWYDSDEFTYAYKTLTGDGTLIARAVSNGTGSNTWAKGGVMIRDSLNGGSTHAIMAMTGGGGNGAAFQYRTETNGDSATIDSASVVTLPYWVKIAKVGDTLTGYVSSDGKTWNERGMMGTTMTDPVCIGIAVTSHEAGVDRTFQFDGIATTGAVTGAWQGAVISSPLHNGPQNFYVTLADNSKSATVNKADIVTSAEWTEVRIPLADFAGVNPAKVKRLTVGVGDPGNPVAGDAGRIFIDDIRVGCVVERAYENLLTNGDIEAGVVDPWTAYGATIEAVQADPAEGAFCMQVTVPTAGANFWDSGVKYAGMTFQNNRTYTLSAFCKCAQGTRQINFKPEMDGGSYAGYGAQVFTITGEWAEYSITTPVFTEDVSPAAITFHVGFAAGVMWMDCIRFYEGDYVAPDLGQ